MEENKKHTVSNDKAELLLPAGSLEKLKIAFTYGADAVYMGTPDLSLRVKSEVTLEDLVEGVKYAHDLGKKVYLTLNMYSHNKDVAKLKEYIETVKDIKPDGLLIADPGVFQFVKNNAPDIPLHISTQANVCSHMTVDFWKAQGASLVVLAREVTFAELKEIRELCPDIKIEAFVHGTMCMTYSGRCLLSNFMVERGANQGSCANSCRWNYKVHVRMKDGNVKELNIDETNAEMFDFYLEEEFRPGEYMEIVEDERGSYIMNSKDLCLMPKLNEYLEIGVDTLKIEGRGKSPYYVATTAKAYRNAIDDWYYDKDSWDYEPYYEELTSVANHGFTLAFHEGRLTNLAHNFEKTDVLSNWDFAGIIKEVTEDAFLIEVKNKMEEGDVIEFVSPVTKENMLLRIYEFEDTKIGEIKKVVHGGMQPLVRIPYQLFNNESVEDLKKNFPLYTVLRKERPLTEMEVTRMEMDLASLKEEVQGVAHTKEGYNQYIALRDKLVKLKEENPDDRAKRAPRFGVDGCCGRGCNGCMVFWHDDAFTKARENLKTMKIGEKL